jgi:hypothetical protein
MQVWRQQAETLCGGPNWNVAVTASSPARAGMNRRQPSGRVSACRFSRGRGDEPNFRSAPSSGALSLAGALNSPHVRI